MQFLDTSLRQKVHSHFKKAIAWVNTFQPCLQGCIHYFIPYHSKDSKRVNIQNAPLHRQSVHGRSLSASEIKRATALFPSFGAVRIDAKSYFSQLATIYFFSS